MRLVTFNILNGRPLDGDPASSRVDVDRFANVVEDLGADVLALQEVDQDQPRSGHTDLTSVAAETMGAAGHRFVPALYGTPGGPWTAAGEERLDGPAYGIAFVSRYPVHDWRVVRLPALPTRVPHVWPDSRRPVLVRDEPRVALVAAVGTPHGQVTFVSTHLSFLPWWNKHQLRMLMRSLSGRALPIVLMGDLNMSPEPAGGITGMDALAAGLTFPAQRPTRQIDHILASGDLPAVTVAGAERMSVSDHCALSADLG